MKPWARRNGGVVRGFTLVEMLVVMALLSLLMLGMVSALRTMAQTEERMDLRSERADEIRIANGFLRATLGRISMRRIKEAQREGDGPYFFTGQSDVVAWVGIMPARHGAGGRYFFRLALEAVPEDPSALVIRFVPWNGGGSSPDWSQAESRVLARRVKSLALGYEDGRQPAPAWMADWSRTDSLPARIRIDVETWDGAWPLWVIAMRALPSSERSGGGTFSSGGD